ncbi:phage tail protein I [Sporomusa sp.]|uniref:phage tail protein I n=1 Tax=Sporomusa sp. TaxID=2078658 RepID=UPI002BEFADB9|nr:phage tail protein I [Sporomusa sp.]HWR07741.1 phage tail protein I [Sporomusa sp.]
MMADISKVALLDLVPVSIRGDPQVQAAAAALDQELKAVTAAIPSTLLISRIDELPESVLDLLAWQFHVDFYEPASLDLAKKRVLVKQSIAWHRRKGTPSVVEEMVQAILDNAIVEEWPEYGGDPYYFRVVKIGGELVDTEAYVLLKKAIDTVKNTRSWLEGISLLRQIDSRIYFGVLQSTHTKVDIFPSAFRMPDISSSLYCGGLIHVHKSEVIPCQTGQAVS